MVGEKKKKFFMFHWVNFIPPSLWEPKLKSLLAIANWWETTIKNLFATTKTIIKRTGEVQKNKNMENWKKREIRVSMIILSNIILTIKNQYIKRKV